MKKAFKILDSKESCGEVKFHRIKKKRIYQVFGFTTNYSRSIILCTTATSVHNSMPLLIYNPYLEAAVEIPSSALRRLFVIANFFPNDIDKRL